MARETMAPQFESSELHRLLPYVADLELEVDRLRMQGQFLQLEMAEALKNIRGRCTSGSPDPGAALREVDEAAQVMEEMLRDVQEWPGYHPALDQVVSVALRPLARRVFRRQQRLQRAPRVELVLEFQCEDLEWFPARLHHILDNLISNALKYRDTTKAESWVRVALNETAGGYELRVCDNGLGLPADRRAEAPALLLRASPTRAIGPGVGLAVVRLLVEQSGGTLTVDSGEGQGSTFVVTLPRYDLTDYLT